ncbi:fatty acyl-CoA hydrolase precursor, medium chain-like isoform X2 [Lissotriton helveticus]
MRSCWRTTFTLFCLLMNALWTAVASEGQEVHRPLVATKYGQVQGTQLGVKGTQRAVNAFFGIPFAKPPLGALRFSPPEPPEAWNNVREAAAYPPMCLQDRNAVQMITTIMQTEVPDFTVSEDCLYLNIYTPADANTLQLPVMVWIHGGGLVAGGASIYDGSALSAYENVVVVTIQYRLGTLGFFSTGDEHARGNWALLDQVAALQWIQENIEPFGGDHDSVTIFGESGGAFSVSALVIANSTGCDSADSAAVVSCMRKKTAEEILQPILDKKFQMVPVVTDGVFFPKNPDEMLSELMSNPVPYLIGVNTHEMGWIVPITMNIPQTILKEGFDRETVNSLTQMFIPVMGSIPEFVPLAIDEYLGDTEDTIMIRDSFLEMLGDIVFILPTVKTATYHRDTGVAVYLYEFQHRPSQFRDSRPDFVKADHGDELGFVFGVPFLDNDVVFLGNVTDEEKDLSKTMMKYWANFARNGNPNGDGLAEWPLYKEDEQYLEISLKQKIGKQLKHHRMAFWTTTLPEKMNAMYAQTKEHTEL